MAGATGKWRASQKRRRIRIRCNGHVRPKHPLPAEFNWAKHSVGCSWVKYLAHCAGVRFLYRCDCRWCGDRQLHLHRNATSAQASGVSFTRNHRQGLWLRALQMLRQPNPNNEPATYEALLRSALCPRISKCTPSADLGPRNRESR